jgi:glyoxylase-like metal-dependent hydrolase (beta-lactamase superfamily II)
MVWDTGFAPGTTTPNAPKVGIVDRLKELNVTPDQVKYVGISHFHGDHTGQLEPFTNATLLIGKGEWDEITAPTSMPGANVAGSRPGSAKVERSSR